MDFEEWEPYYKDILRDFGYSRDEDESSARLLEKLVPKERLMDVQCLRMMVRGDVTVLGNGPMLEKALSEYRNGTLISAGCSTSVLMKRDICPDIMVTDLDGPLDADIEFNRKGAVAVLHAHGDNKHLIKKYVDKFKGKIVISTQSRPFGDLINVGGFTDGDRAVMLARSLGAKKLALAGFDFERPVIKIGTDIDIKKRKLAWAKRIIFELNPQDVEITII
jgi:2-amino-4-hydroxy-6-hydroxymethyldihydropteridine diphosphokinase